MFLKLWVRLRLGLLEPKEGIKEMSLQPTLNFAGRITPDSQVALGSRG